MKLYIGIGIFLFIIISLSSISAFQLPNLKDGNNNLPSLDEGEIIFNEGAFFNNQVDFNQEVNINNNVNVYGIITFINSVAQPTCNVSTRGDVYFLKGDVGVSDGFKICIKNALNVYGWVNINLT